MDGEYTFVIVGLDGLVRDVAANWVIVKEEKERGISKKKSVLVRNLVTSGELPACGHRTW